MQEQMRLQFARAAPEACCDLAPFGNTDEMTATVDCGQKRAEIVKAFSRKASYDN